MTEPTPTTSRTVPSPFRPARLALVLAILASSIGCDRATKIYADANLRFARPMSFLGNVLRVQYAQNTGAFLSLGSTLPEPVRRFIFIGGVGAIVVLMLIFAFGRDRPTLQVIAASLLASGGMGNLYDRIFGGGAVTDFLNLGIGPVRTGIFNVADLAIVAGAVLLALAPKGPQRASAPQETPPARPGA